MSGMRRAGGVGTQRNIIVIRRYVRVQAAFENSVRMHRTQGTEKRPRMPRDVAPPPQTQDKSLLMYGILKEVNKINPSLLLPLLGPLLSYGFHPASLTEDNGIVVSKPGKSDYSAPSLFRVIVHLQTVSKILKRIIAFRISPLARMVGLVQRNQCGSLPSLSTFDACTALLQEVCTLQRPALKASTLFLDIKGSLDNISCLVLTSLLR